jgi:DNA replication and repair protein RecF
MLHLRISKLQAGNFRNLNSNVIEFGPYINCIFGENGNGKTNILEAIYYLSRRKSFRKNASFPQMLGIDGEKPEISFLSAFVSNENEVLSYSGKLNQEGSEWYLNGKPTKKKLAFPVLFINPFDSYAFHTSSQARRDWVDDQLSTLLPEYAQHLKRFQSALRQRNKLLQERERDCRAQLAALDKPFCQDIFLINQMRRAFLEDINPHLAPAFKSIFCEEHHLELRLESKLAHLSADEVYASFREAQEKDLLAGITRKGPHRDDFVLLFDQFNAFEYCSLGQQKTSYLSLLFAYIELFRYKFTSFPIVLLDDVSGELDQNRWKRLVSYLQETRFQVLITTANEKFKEELEQIQDANKLLVSSGSIQKI